MFKTKKVCLCVDSCVFVCAASPACEVCFLMANVFFADKALCLLRV